MISDVGNIPALIMNLLDERLLDLVTSKDGELFISSEEYEIWKTNGRLDHLSRIRVIQDIVAWVANETRQDYRGLCYRLGISDHDLDLWRP